MNFYDHLRPHQQLMIERIGRALLTIGVITIAAFMVTSFRLPPATSPADHDAALEHPWTQGAGSAWRATRRSLRLMRGRYYVPHYTVSP